MTHLTRHTNKSPRASATLLALAVAAVVLAVVAARQAQAADRPPNIVYILADDK